jgi:hypothetical protein
MATMIYHNDLIIRNAYLVKKEIRKKKYLLFFLTSEKRIFAVVEKITVNFLRNKKR